MRAAALLDPEIIPSALPALDAAPEKYLLVFEYSGFYPSQPIVNSKVDRWESWQRLFRTLPPEINRNLISSGSTLTHEELKAAEHAANPDDQWREAGIIEKEWGE